MSEENYAEEELEKAEKTFQDAKILNRDEGSEQSVASLLYFVCYHSAKAVLYSQGLNPKSHAGVVSLFGQEIVDREQVTREDARFLSRSQTRREKAEYDYEPVNEDLEELFNRTEQFMIKMKEYVRRNSDE